MGLNYLTIIWKPYEKYIFLGSIPNQWNQSLRRLHVSFTFPVSLVCMTSVKTLPANTELSTRKGNN